MPARPTEAAQPAQPSPHVTPSPPPDPFADERSEMVREQIAARGVRDPAVLAAMSAVPRHLFVPDDVRESAYADMPLPIGHDVTISQPYIVALMTELAHVGPGARVLEVGTGSGYQAAVLEHLGAEVYSVEILEPHATAAAERLKRLGFHKVHVRHGDGHAGWPEHAPYDAILVTAAPAQVPQALREQLAMGGRLVIPVGTYDQELRVLTRTPTGFQERSEIPVRFVPMTSGG